MYRCDGFYIQLHYLSISIWIGSNIELFKNNICDLLHFLWITYFVIFFDLNFYGYLDFMDRMDINNGSN